jgi:hypothetical protein
MSRLTSSDLPLLRHVDQVLEGMIDHANRIKTASEDVGEMLAAASILDLLQTERDRAQRSIRKLSQ